MEIIIETTFERDIDLLVLEEFLSDKLIAMLFLKTANVSDDFEAVKELYRAYIDKIYGKCRLLKPVNHQ